MDVEVAKKDVARAMRAGEAESLWAKVRGAVAASAWGSLAGKGLVYVAGFLLLAAVGSGKIHCLAASSRAPAMAASIAPPSVSALPPTTAPGAPPESQPAESAGTDAGSEDHEKRGALLVDAGAPPADAGAEDGGMLEGKVALNRATEEDLRHLPGIGATRARAILALRAKIGRFSRVEELLKVKGIGRRSLRRFRPLVLID